VLSETTAKTSGITALTETIKVHGYGGLTFSARPGVIPELRIGTAVLRNVVVMIAPDKDLNIKALLGYPVAGALGKLTFHEDGSLMIGSQRDSAAEGTRLWIGDESLLISLNTVPAADGKAGGGTRPRLFVLDTGSGRISQHPREGSRLRTSFSQLR
jgi:hypothetical protein